MSTHYSAGSNELTGSLSPFVCGCRSAGRLLAGVSKTANQAFVKQSRNLQTFTETFTYCLSNIITGVLCLSKKSESLYVQCTLVHCICRICKRRLFCCPYPLPCCTANQHDKARLSFVWRHTDLHMTCHFADDLSLCFTCALTVLSMCEVR